jgi:hypothetical protein
MQNSYLRIEGRHPILSGLEDAGRIINGVRRVDVEPLGTTLPPPLTVIPSYPDLPMEEVYARVEKTDIPGVFLREIGPSRIVYFPWDIDRTFWEVLSPDHGKLLRNAVNWATNEVDAVTVTGPGILDVAVWRQKDSMTVHLVNLNNPMMMKGPLREIIPAPAQRVRVRLPEGVRASAVHLLVAGTSVNAHHSGRDITVDVPSIRVHEVVAVDLVEQVSRPVRPPG